MDNNLEQKTSPRDFFLHLLAIITLYLSAVALATLLFQYINLAFPDQLENGFFAYEGILQKLRWLL